VWRSDARTASPLHHRRMLLPRMLPFLMLPFLMLTHLLLVKEIGIERVLIFLAVLVQKYTY
jgi:hypothetical protein